MLRLENITKDYKVAGGAVPALKGLSVSFRKNEFVSILGPSGCGKTTLLNIIGGLDKYTEGDLIINGRSTKEYKDRDWDVYRNHRVGFVFQSYNLIPHQTVLGNVELALTIAGMPKAARREKARIALEKVGLGDQIYKHPNQLSGGQCQRVAIARALVNDPEILLADEPTGALDSKTSVQIMELMKEIAGERLVIMVTHNPELAEQYSTRIIKLFDGLIVDDSDPFSDAEEIAETKAIIATESTGGNSIKAKNKVKMGFWTAFALSSRNLMAKKGRTIMVCIAGSIGIIGVAVVLAFSSGITNYIEGMEDDMLSGNPITIEESTYDYASLMSRFTQEERDNIVKEADRVYINSVVGNIASMTNVVISNDISADYINYVKAMPDNYYAAMALDYGIDVAYNIFTDYRINDSSATENVSIYALKEIYTAVLKETDYAEYASYITSLTDIFMQAPNSKEYIESQYDVKGKIATAKDEVMIVLNSDQKVSDLTLAQLGYMPQDVFINQAYKAAEHEAYDKTLDVESYSYDDITSKTFTWYKNDSLFAEDTNTMDGVAFNYNGYSDEIVDKSDSIELKVVGVLKPKEEIAYGCLTSGMYYTEALTEYALGIENKDETRSVINKYLDEQTGKQVTSGQVDFGGMSISSGITFDYHFAYDGTLHDNITGYVGSQSAMSSLLSSMMGGTEGAASTYYTLNLRALGGNNVANNVEIFPNDFDSKYLVTEYLDAWNADGTITFTLDGVEYTIDKESRSEIKYTDTLELIISLINTMIQMITVGLIAFTSVSLVVSTVMIGIITYVSVVERIKEIGIIRAMGGRKRDVKNLFTAETFIIGFVSGLIGIAFTYFASFIVNMIIGAAVGISTIAALPWFEAIIMVAVSVGLTLISGLIPASAAAKQDPVVALRTE